MTDGAPHTLTHTHGLNEQKIVTLGVVDGCTESIGTVTFVQNVICSVGHQNSRKDDTQQTINDVE